MSLKEQELLLGIKRGSNKFSQSNFDNWKTVKLPSNGLSYPAFVKIKPFTNEVFFTMNDPFFNTNETELTIALLEKHYIGPDLLDLYFVDLYYIYNTLYNEAFVNEKISSLEFCSHCLDVNSIEFPIEDTTIKYLSTDNYQQKQIKFGENTVFLNIRTAKDNLNTAYINFFNNNIETIDLSYTSIINFIQPQVDYITNKDGVKLKSDKLTNLLKYNNDKKAFQKLFVETMQDDFGIKAKGKYICNSCKKENTIKLNPIFNYSFFFNKSEQLPKQIANIKSSINNLLSLCNNFNISFSELLSLPVSKTNLFYEEAGNVLESSNPKKKGTSNYIENINNYGKNT